MICPWGTESSGSSSLQRQTQQNNFPSSFLQMLANFYQKANSQACVAKIINGNKVEKYRGVIIGCGIFGLFTVYWPGGGEIISVF